MNSIAAKRNCIGDLGGMLVDLDLDASLADSAIAISKKLATDMGFKGSWLSHPSLVAISRTCRLKSNTISKARSS